MVSKNGPMLCTYSCNLENGVQKWSFKMYIQNGQ